MAVGAKLFVDEYTITAKIITTIPTKISEENIVAGNDDVILSIIKRTNTTAKVETADNNLDYL